MQERKPILITGSHRSGSTWVGKIISESTAVGYIHEPFNPENPPITGISKPEINYWFPYICKENQIDFYRYFYDIINFNNNFFWEIKNIKTIKDVKRIIKEYFRFIKYQYYQVKPLVKDPIALLSAEWLHSNFDMDIVVLIRHPAAFASSLKTWNWSFPFEHFLEQPLLMKYHLSHFENEIKAHVKKEHDIIDQAALLWKILYSRVLDYQNKYFNDPNWIFIHHEDISKNPFLEFQNLFDFLNLKFTVNIQNIIKEYCSESNPMEAQTVNSLKRNSESNIKIWKNRLTSEEINRVRKQVEEISCHFYGDADW